jgi:type IV pilus biogenesis protein CpaD/CtpE
MRHAPVILLILALASLAGCATRDVQPEESITEIVAALKSLKGDAE